MVTESAAPTYDPAGGRLCLDFANVANRPLEGPVKEVLHRYEDLLAWCRDAGALAVAQSWRLARTAKSRPAAARAVVMRARELREAIFRVFFAPVEGRTPLGKDLDAINRELGAALAHARLVRGQGGYSWGWDDSADELAAPLWPIVQSAAELLTGEERERVKRCASHTCLWLFVDTTKNGARRWCDMKTCGNRAKVRKHRGRG